MITGLFIALAGYIYFRLQNDSHGNAIRSAFALALLCIIPFLGMSVGSMPVIDRAVRGR